MPEDPQCDCYTDVIIYEDLSGVVKRESARIVHFDDCSIIRSRGLVDW